MANCSSGWGASIKKKDPNSNTVSTLKRPPKKPFHPARKLVQNADGNWVVADDEGRVIHKKEYDVKPWPESWLTPEQKEKQREKRRELQEKEQERKRLYETIKEAVRDSWW
ncbi:hypothetical protein [Succinimonas sp.]|uniref:hypothetical protein n=1 Tax=Succinimonas sp. TaxID=1936151 RepID=UPI00386F658B